MSRPSPAAAYFSLAAIGLLWTLPFLQPYHSYPLTSFYSEWLALVLGLAGLVALIDRRCWRETPLPWAALFVFGFAALLVLQSALDRVAYAGQALTAVLYLVWAILLMVLACVLRRALGLTAVATTLAWFLFAAGWLSALIALLQHYDVSTVLDPLIARKSSAAAYGNLAQRNHFADYAALAFASLAYLRARGRLHGAVALAGAVPLAFMLGLSGSRSVLLYLTLTLALALPFKRRDDEGSRRLLMCVTTFIAASVVAQWLAVLPWFLPAGGAVTTVQRLFSDTASVEERLQTSYEAWSMFLEAPLLGVGWGQFAWNEFVHRAQSGTHIGGWPFNNVHNIVLHLLSETGLAGALLIGSAALSWLWALKRVALDLERWWVLALLGVIGTHSMLEFPLWYAYFLGIAAFVFGLGSEHNFRVSFDRAAPLLMLLLIGMGAIAALPVLGAYRDFDRLFAREGSTVGESERNAIVSRAYREPVLRPYAELAISFGIDVSSEQLRDKLELNGRVMRFAPIDVVVYRQALLLALAGEREAAQRQFARAAIVYPHELPAAVKTLRELAARYPAELTPLLELAAAKGMELRARAGAR